jgi:DNA-binding IclR family transcriptional regulator
MLASLSQSEVCQIATRRGLPGFTDRTLCSLDHLHADIELTRTRGYALDLEENEEGVRCLAASVLDIGGFGAVAISVSGPAIRITESRMPQIAADVLHTAAAISREYSRVRRSGDS